MVPFLTFPLRLREGGVLHRSDEADAVLRFLHVMAATPGGTWKGCQAFGIRDLLESKTQAAELCRMVAERANRAFQNLGIVHYQVEEVIRQETIDGSRVEFSIVIRDVSAGRTHVTHVHQDGAGASRPRAAGLSGAAQ